MKLSPSSSHIQALVQALLFKLFQKSSNWFHLLPIPSFVFAHLNSLCTLQPVLYLPGTHGLCFQPMGGVSVVGETVREALCLLLWLREAPKWLPLLPGLSLERWTCPPFQGRSSIFLLSDQWTQMHGTPKKIQTGLYFRFQKIKYKLYRVIGRGQGRLWIALHPYLSNPHSWRSLPRPSFSMSPHGYSYQRQSFSPMNLFLSLLLVTLFLPPLCLTSSSSPLLG